MQSQHDEHDDNARGGVSTTPVEFGLRPPPFWSGSFPSFFLVLAAVVVGYYVTVLPQALAEHRLLTLVGPVLLVVVAVVGRVFLRPRKVPPLVFRDEHLEAPRSPESRRATRIHYRDILSVDLRGRGNSERLFIGTAERLFAYPRGAFVRPEATDQALRELYLRILRLPDGAGIVERIARRRKLALSALANNASATNLLLLLIAMIFGLSHLGGAFDTPTGSLRFGASAPLLVRDGEVYRLLASTFLHAGVVHLYFNALALFLLGSIVERLLGHARFLIIYLFSGLAAAVASTSAGSLLPAVGASGAIFGVFGGLAVVNWRYGRQLPIGFRQPLRWWLFIGGLQVVLPLFVPQIDYVAHLGGFFAGVVVTLLVLDGTELNPQARARPTLRLLAAVLVGLYVAALGTALGHASRDGRAVELHYMQQLAQAPSTQPIAINNLAYQWASTAGAHKSELSAALVLAERALSEEPNEPTVTDTVAALRYRLGQSAEAVHLQRQALADLHEPILALHLAQFLTADAQAHPPALPPLSFSVRGEHIELQLHEPEKISTEGFTLFAVGSRDGKPVALVRMAAPHPPAGELSVTSKVKLPAANYEVLLFEPGCSGCEGGVRLATWNLEDSAIDLPQPQD